MRIAEIPEIPEPEIEVEYSKSKKKKKVEAVKSKAPKRIKNIDKIKAGSSKNTTD